ncbi:thioredoxin [Candidatus Altiarchaeota archaeon]
MAEVVELTEESFDEFVKSSPVAVVDFWAPWCGPCKMIEPIVEELAEEYGGKAVFGKTNVDENREKAVEHGIMSIPTLLVFKDGEKVDQIIGAVPKESIAEKIKPLL